MKKYRLGLLAAVALAGLVACALSASAQEAKQGKKGGDTERRGQMAQQRVEYLSKELDLTAEQKTKLTALFEEEGKKMREMRDLTPEQRREKATAMREENQKKMKEILTPAQYEKWEKSRAEMRKRAPGERKGEGKGEGKAQGKKEA